MKCLLLHLLLLGAFLVITYASESEEEKAATLDSRRNTRMRALGILGSLYNYLISGLPTTAEKVRVGAIRFSGAAQEGNPIGKHDTTDELLAEMDKVPFSEPTYESKAQVDESLKNMKGGSGGQKFAGAAQEGNPIGKHDTTDELSAEMDEVPFSEPTYESKAQVDESLKNMKGGPGGKSAGRKQRSLQRDQEYNNKRDKNLGNFVGDRQYTMYPYRQPKFPTYKDYSRLTIDDMVFFKQVVPAGNGDSKNIKANQEEGVIGNCTDSDPWTAPSGWTGPEAAYYKSFDNTDCMSLYNGAKLTPGKVGQAVTTDSAKEQYVDLGVIADQACIVTPSTCQEGGSFGGWMRLIPSKSWTTSYDYIMSSVDQHEPIPNGHGYNTVYEGLSIRNRGSLEVTVYTDDHESTRFYPYEYVRDKWFYITVVYNATINATMQQDTYINGEPVVVWSGHHNNQIYVRNSGSLVVGRQYAVYPYSEPTAWAYSSVAVDDLVFFNQTLTAEQVKDLYDSY